MTKFSEANDELLKRISEGDESAREEIIEQNIGLVRSIVKRFLGRGHEAEDLFQIDRSYGVTFSTYAVPMIIGEIKRFIRDDGIIKVSRAYKDISYKAFTVKERMMAEQKTEPTLAEIANELNITPQELSTAMEAARSPESLYAQTDDGKSEGRSLIEKLPSDEDYEQKIENRILLSQAFKGMDERERMIIYMRYFRQKTQSEIAAILGISQVQVSRIEKKVLMKMRDKLTG